jgi:peptidoglycan/LPS O-acetylase OafA/YrhL
LGPPIPFIPLVDQADLSHSTIGLNTSMDRQGNANDRNPALDFTKGMLVLFMVLYHWINYFVGLEGPIYLYLRFIPPSFIFIAGFLMANVYPAKYGIKDSRLYMRLIIRGLKLLALFTLLNVTANMFFARSYKGAMPGVEGFISNAGNIYISGSARASFGVLVPIGLLLILSVGIFLAVQAYKYSVHLICAASFLCVSLLNLYGFPSPNLSLIAIGILGMVFGFYPIEKVNNWTGYPYIVVGLNVSYIFAIGIWGESYLLQVVGVCLSVMFIYLAGIRSAAWGEIRSPIILLGKYSLFGYVAQIGILQILQRGLLYLNFHNWALWIISFFGAFALTFISVKMAHQIRTKSCAADRLYRFVFS